jgi:uncharacterized membrane protein YjgN (DUF898 family)
MANVPLSSEPREIPLEWSGQAAEYFRIWIVNLGLTLLTLGIYSAWAKVRTRQYFYGNLRIEGSAFEYTADPVRILIGRMLVAVFAGAYALATATLPALAGAIAVLFFVATPWVAVRALAFNHRNTRWRNLRFGFRGRTGEAARVYLGWPILAALTLGLLIPHAHARRHAFLVGNSRYGAERFSFQWQARAYFGPYLKAFFVVVLGIAALVATAALLARLGLAEQPAEGEASSAGIVAALPLLASYGAAFVMVQAGTTNLLYGGASLAGHRFRSELRFRDLLWLYATSALAIALSFGMLIPWAHVRLARYRASKLVLLAHGDLASFVAAAEEEERLGALADEAAVAFDFDFGL